MVVRLSTENAVTKEELRVTGGWKAYENWVRGWGGTATNITIVD